MKKICIPWKTASNFLSLRLKYELGESWRPATMTKALPMKRSLSKIVYSSEDRRIMGGRGAGWDGIV